jgi:hypothetical protein
MEAQATPGTPDIGPERGPRQDAPSPLLSEEVVPGEGVVGRALVLAQRMADQVIAEAEQTGQRVRERAEDDADRIRRAAASESETIIARLEERRRELEAQLHDLDAWVMQRRETLQQMLAEGLRTLDEWLNRGASPTNAYEPTHQHAAPGRPET